MSERPQVKNNDGRPQTTGLTDDERHSKWSWHAQCVANADRAYAARDMQSWEEWSQRAAVILRELV